MILVFLLLLIYKQYVGNVNKYNRVILSTHEGLSLEAHILVGNSHLFTYLHV
jgi:hypothetical protein